MTTPIIISIDGNIGAGKSTFLNQLKKQFPKFHYVDEPVDTWTKFVNEEGESLLEVFYKDRKRWSYTFQNCAFMTRTRAIVQAIKEWKQKCLIDPEEIKNNVFITERCVETDFNVFAKMLYQDGSLDKMITLKKPIYIRPTNSIPNVYDRGIGQYVNASGCMNATGFQDDLNYNCNPGNLKKSQVSAQTDIPKLP
jgi:deoxyadenosine/deoxycytidine kinase